MSHNILYFEYFCSKGPFQNCENSIFFRKKSFFMISNYQKWLICIKTNINDMSHNILYFEYFRPKGPFQNCENGIFSKKIISNPFLSPKDDLDV